MVFAAAVAFASEVLLNAIQHIVLSDIIPPNIEESMAWTLQYSLQHLVISLVTGPMLIFTATYFIRTAYDLRREYKVLLVVMFSGAFSGYIVGAATWGWIAVATGIWQAAPNTTLESYYLPFWLPLRVMQSLSKSFGYVFIAFTALAIAYLRRRDQKDRRE